MRENEKKVQLITDDLYRRVLSDAENSPRKRMNYNFHSLMEENPHRFLNVLCSGTFITPHRHLHPPKTESFILLSGKLAFYIFNEKGDIDDIHILSDARGFSHGIDISPGVWHTLAVLSEYAVCFEVKPGPYVPSDDKEFAEWAPSENQEDANNYLKKLLSVLPAE